MFFHYVLPSSMWAWFSFHQSLLKLPLVGGQVDPGQAWSCPGRNINHCCVMWPRNKGILPCYVMSPGEICIPHTLTAGGAIDLAPSSLAIPKMGTSENGQQQPAIATCTSNILPCDHSVGRAASLLDEIKTHSATSLSWTWVRDWQVSLAAFR